MDNWTTARPEENGTFWVVQKYFENGKLKSTHGPSICNIDVPEDINRNIFINWPGSDDPDMIVCESEMVIERLAPRDPIFGWDKKEDAERKIRDVITKRWEYWLLRVEEPVFKDGFVTPYPVLHQEGIVSMENPLPDNRESHGDLGVQIATDGRIWVCFDGAALLRFKPISKATYETLRLAASKAAVIKEDEV